MSVVVIGVNNRTMPLELFERLAITPDAMPKALADLATRRHVSEVVLVSTCNRTEVYAYAEKFHGAYQDVRDFLAESAHLAPEDFADHVTVHYDAEAVRHLFSVTAGLDSAVLGENEIQRQVKNAWETAQDEGTVGPSLNALFRHALEVGKAVRTDTGISRNIASVSHAAVAMADRHLGGLAGRRVLVLGAGEMGRGMAATLASADLGAITFANRSLDRARSLAEQVGGDVISLDGLVGALDQADVLLTSTGAQSLMVDLDEMAQVMDSRNGRPLLIVDLAVPRDVDPAVASLDGVTLFDMDDIGAFADAGRREREAELGNARAVITTELDRYLELVSARQVAPLVASFRSEAEAIRVAELARHNAKLAQLDDEARAAVEAITQGILGKLLHEPTVRLNQAAGTHAASASPTHSASCSTCEPPASDPRRCHDRPGRRIGGDDRSDAVTTIRAATRASPLARWQTDRVAELLAVHDVNVEPVVVSTTGDERLDVPIHAMGGKGVFVTEVQRAVLDGRADIAVHSMKDLPSITEPGLVLACVPERADPRDALVGARLADLAPGASVATGSIRRRAQLAALRPDLVFSELRGNIATRLAKAEGFDAVVMAAAAIVRLGIEPQTWEPLPVDVMVPQVGQGALAVECRADDASTTALLASIDDTDAHRLTDAERAFLATLGGDCDLPAAAHAIAPDPGGRITLRSLLAAEDGSVVLRDEREGHDGPGLGSAAATALLDGGGRALLAHRG